MSWERIADRKIHEATQAGKFDGLPHGTTIDLERRRLVRREPQGLSPEP